MKKLKKVNHLKPRKYIISSRKFEGASADVCPCVGQIGINSKLIAYLFFYRLKRFSYNNAYTIAVMLMKRIKSTSSYQVIKR